MNKSSLTFSPAPAAPALRSLVVTSCALAWCLGLPAAYAQAQPDHGLGKVDFRYSLPWWQSAICLPDDPDKTLVGKEGQVLFDFGAREGFRSFGIMCQPTVVGELKWLRQETVSPRAPIVRTFQDADGVEVTQETFVVTPMPGQVDAPPRLVRSDSLSRQNGWAKPAMACAQVFTGVDIGWGSSIQYQLLAPSNGKATVVLGLCEGYHKEAGVRPLKLIVEGAAPKTVDPVKDFGPAMPGICTFAGQDVNNDGVIDITVDSPTEAKDHNTILNAIWAFDGPAPADEAIIKGALPTEAYASSANASLPERQVVVLVTLKNGTTQRATRQPAIIVRSVEPAYVTPDKTTVQIGEDTQVLASAPIDSTAPSGDAKTRAIMVKLSAVELEAGAQHQLVFTVSRHARKPVAALDVDQAVALRDTARQWWENADLPFTTIQVPDTGIQDMLESCVRNIWQAREIKKGKPAFHVGPTVYRGLWIVDGAFLLESAALVGRGQDARAGVEYMLSHQKPDGSFEILRRYWKENGIVLWTATRHAVLTQDKTWLRAQWPALERVVKVIQRLRTENSKDPNALDYRLIPPGFIDGGLNGGNKPDYSNTVWCLAGLKSAIAAAHWLGEEATAADWQKEYDDFYATYRKAAARDTLKDAHGNAYVPTMMGNEGKHLPQRAQWAWCHSVYPGQIFPQNDPLVQGNLAMLRATKVQGMVYGTGWAANGIWTYFASFYAHALLWEGHGREAAEVLYDYARHACPLRVWREEQLPVGKGGDEVGDMPHNWASAEFIRLAVHLIELDRGTELHLLEGFPAEWAGPGMVTKLNGVLTPFGPLHLEIRITADGKSAQVKMQQLKASPPTKVVLHLDGLTGKPGTKELPTDRDVNETIAK